MTDLLDKKRAKKLEHPALIELRQFGKFTNNSEFIEKWIDENIINLRTEIGLIGRVNFSPTQNELILNNLVGQVVDDMMAQKMVYLQDLNNRLTCDIFTLKSAFKGSK